jgi:hypothetical protein
MTHPLPSFGDLKIASYALCPTHNQEFGKLEEDAKPILLPMVFGQADPVRLTNRDQTMLATWATLTGIMLGQTRAGESLPVPESHRAGFLSTKRPPGGVTVWIGALFDPTRGVFEFQELHDLEPDDPSPRGYAATICWGYLILVVLGDKDGTDPDISQASNLGEFLARLWPTTGGDLFWPPRSLAFDDPGLLALSGTLRHVFGSG